jgi:hypothetical protein
LFSEPAGEVIRVIEASLCGGGGDTRSRTQGGLGGLESFMIAQAAQAEAMFPL